MITEPQSVNATGHSDVLAALRVASRKTGLDFDYLLNTAMRESSLDTQAKSKSSSAAGLFQFIDQTWLGLVKRFGERYGLGSYANAIQQNGSGRYTVASADTKSAILALRQDPQLSALMAGESAKQTKQSLECALGREVCGGELYAAHFLGPSGARNLIQTKERDPSARADLAFPQAAKANKSIFYRADGSAKTVGELYASIVGHQSSAQTPAISKPLPELRLLAANVTVADHNDAFAPLAQASQLDDTSKMQSDEDRQPPETSVYPTWWRGQEPRLSVEPRLLPQAPVLLTPGIVEILASLGPAGIGRRAA